LILLRCAPLPSRRSDSARRIGQTMYPTSNLRSRLNAYDAPAYPNPINFKLPLPPALVSNRFCWAALESPALDYVHPPSSAHPSCPSPLSAAMMMRALYGIPNSMQAVSGIKKTDPCCLASFLTTRRGGIDQLATRHIFLGYHLVPESASIHLAVGPHR
jgi:hypothetical protein